MVKITLQQQLTESQRKIEDLKFQLAVETSVLERLQCVEIPKDTGNGGPKPTASGSIASGVEKALLEIGHKMSLDEITTALESRGIKSDSKHGLRSVVLSAIVRREDLFVRDGRGIYDLKSRHEKKE